MDGQLVDLPLSRAFLKCMCGGELGFPKPPSSQEATSLASPSASLDSLASLAEGEAEEDEDAWFARILSFEDVADAYGEFGQFLLQLSQLSASKHSILSDSRLSPQQRLHQIANLTLPPPASVDPLQPPPPAARLADLCLSLQYLAPSSHLGYAALELVPGGANIDLSMDTLDDYLRAVKNWILNAGIRRQMDAFKQGFDEVFPLEKLRAFGPEEVRLLVCGEPQLQWTKEHILAHTVPTNGYTKTSPAFQRLVNVLVSLTTEQRKAFLQFTTGSSTLPPGGLANLHPRLTIVKKAQEQPDKAYPSVSTCVHFLKLPDYSTEAVMRERLLAATRVKGFHLN